MPLFNAKISQIISMPSPYTITTVVYSIAAIIPVYSAYLSTLFLLSVLPVFFTSSSMKAHLYPKQKCWSYSRTPKNLSVSLL